LFRKSKKYFLNEYGKEEIMDFKERVAIVTGAGSKKGIGRETALMLAQGGACVVVADMDLTGAQEVVKEIEALGTKGLAVQANVTDEASVDETVRKAIEKFGKIDILVNNAGITQPIKTIDMSVADFNKVLNVNLTGTFIVTKAVMKEMIKKKYGRIVSLSSVSGKRGGGVYGGSHYSAAKAGILGFSKALAREVVEDGITVNCVCPGLVATDIRKGLSDERERAIWQDIPIKRPATTKEIAYTICFLASEGAGYITGEDIDINGGSHMD
jgi:NAD(P)-dependent dehydrogenase (short-subunit alcohol dehydrogenase family)